MVLDYLSFVHIYVSKCPVSESKQASACPQARLAARGATASWGLAGKARRKGSECVAQVCCLVQSGARPRGLLWSRSQELLTAPLPVAALEHETWIELTEGRARREGRPGPARRRSPTTAE